MQGLDEHQLTQLNNHLATEEAGQTAEEHWQELCQLIDDDLASIARYFEARKLEEASGAAADLAKRLEEQLS